MNCFEHPQKPAVGTCTNCGRGLCKECTTVVEGKLSCRGTCQAEIERGRRVLAASETSLNQRSVIYETSAKVYQRSFAFSSVMGALFTVIGCVLFMSQAEIPGAIMLGLGILFILHGIGMGRAGKKMKSLAAEGSTTTEASQTRDRSAQPTTINKQLSTIHTSYEHPY
jgi:hypothetical protein